MEEALNLSFDRLRLMMMMMMMMTLGYKGILLFAPIVTAVVLLIQTNPTITCVTL